jgi:two-component system response regulator DegU
MSTTLPAPTHDPIRLLLVEDHPLLIQGLRHVLEAVDGLTVAGEATDGESAVTQAALLHPDVVLMDVNLPRKKDVHPELLVETIRRVVEGKVLAGDRVMTRAEADRWLGVDLPPGLEPGDGAGLLPLSGREMEVLALVVRGQSNKEIAQHLTLSPQTVKNHLFSLMRKLGVADRTQAALLAVQKGWVPDEPVRKSDRG